MELKLSLDEHEFLVGEEVVAVLTFVGHPKLNLFAGSQLMCVSPSVNSGSGYSIELFDSEGRRLPFNEASRGVLRVDIPGLKEGNAYVYRFI